MAFSVVMPALEMAQETGKLVAWRKAEGDSVTKGEPLLEIETDKAVLEVESPADGVLAGVKAQAGDVVPVGNIIAWIVRAGEAPPSEAVLSGAPAANEPGSKNAPAPVMAAPAASAGAQISPKARRLAKEHGVDIVSLRGSGPGGEILASDVLAVAESKSSSPPAPVSAPRDVETPSSIGRLMAERTTQSWTTVPHFFVVREVDAGALVETRERLGSAIQQSRGTKLTHTDFLVALVARVLVKHPRINASWNDGVIRLNQEVNISVAMAVDDGVVATVIHHANQADLGEIAVQRRDLTERARASRLRPTDITGATFTISNLGMYQVDAFSAIISPPQAAILAVGSITDRVVPIGGRAAIRPMMTLTLSCDHRVVDGARAAVFLNEVAEAVREPEKWLR
ncbi:MAG TPA: dihydrolipoamide acetyltransferase family protein [Terriglobales bacterium]|nr:dihydrolipoamide acetyltransferase family protein [Terriglobales bacterium]